MKNLKWLPLLLIATQSFADNTDLGCVPGAYGVTHATRIGKDVLAICRLEDGHGKLQELPGLQLLETLEALEPGPAFQDRWASVVGTPWEETIDYLETYRDGGENAGFPVDAVATGNESIQSIATLLNNQLGMTGEVEQLARRQMALSEYTETAAQSRLTLADLEDVANRNRSIIRAYGNGGCDAALDNLTATPLTVVELSYPDGRTGQMIVTRAVRGTNGINLDIEYYIPGRSELITTGRILLTDPPVIMDRAGDLTFPLANANLAVVNPEVALPTAARVAGVPAVCRIAEMSQGALRPPATTETLPRVTQEAAVTTPAEVFWIR